MPPAKKGSSRTTKIVSDYLKSLAATKKSKNQNLSSLKRQYDNVNKRFKNSRSGISKLKLHAKRDELKKRIKIAEKSSASLQNHKKLEADFIKIAAKYAIDSKIPASAWRASGVPQAVLIKAGLSKPRKRRAKNTRTKSTRSKK